MALTIENGAKSAKQKAAGSKPLYAKAKAIFGGVLEKYHSDSPIAMGLGHVLSVNPSLQRVPPPTKDQRRGFLFATRQTAANSGIAWENLDDVNTCAYVWGRDINGVGKSLYQNNPTLFTTPNEDFWRCVYLRHRLGPAVFDALWSARDTSQPTVYDGLLYAVNNRTKRLLGLSVVELKNVVFMDCAYAYEITKMGGSLQTKGYGIEPVLTQNDTLRVFKF